MKTKMKKILIGGLTIGAVVAPIASTVACGSSSTTIQTDKIINDGANIFADGYGRNLTYSDFKNIVDKQQDVQTASSNFISQIKYELTETLYNKEQVASFDYQIAFLRWNIFTQEKAQMNLVKEMAALIYDETTTAAQIDNNVTPQIGANFVSISTALGTSAKTSKDIFEFVNKMSKDPQKYIKTPTVDIKAERKTSFNTSLENFKTNFTNIEKLNTKLEDLKKADKNNNAGWTGWDSSTLASDYPKLLKPISKIREVQLKEYNEKKAQTIDKYKTTGDGVEAWASERSSSYGGASTDDEAVKYLVNQQIKDAAFGKYTYSLDNSYTIEQMLATYDDGGTTKHVFPWFDSFDINSLGDKNTKVGSAAQQLYIWTNDVSKFKSENVNSIDISNLKDQKSEITPLLSKNIFFLARKTLVADGIIAKLDSTQEKDNFKNGSPILITHSLIGAKQGTASNLSWTVTKDSIKNLLGFSKQPDINNAHLGIDLFTKLYMDDTGTSTDNKDMTDLFNQYVSDDTGSRVNNGELGVQTYQWYAKKGGMNDGFALATMVAYSDLRNDQNTGAKPKFDIDAAMVKDGAANDGERIIASLKTNILNKVPQDILSGFIDDANKDGKLDFTATVDKVASGDKFKANITTADVNTQLSNWIDSLTDDEVKVMFGSIFKNAFANRPTVYELNPSSTTAGAVHNRFLLASPDSGVHIIKITAETNDWQARYEEDMQNVSQEDNVSKAKITWSTIYSGFFTDNEIISNLLSDVKDANGLSQPSEFAKQIQEIPAKNSTLFSEWVKAGYVSKGADDVASGQAIIESVMKSIEATRLNTQSQSARDSLTDRINTYLIGQMDNKFMDPTVDATKLYNELLKSLLP